MSLLGSDIQKIKDIQNADVSSQGSDFLGVGGDSKRSGVTLFLNSRRGIAPVKPFTQEGQV